MVRKSAFIVSLGVAMLCCVVGSLWSNSRAPRFYRQELRREVPPEVRKQQAEELVEQTLKLVKKIQQADHWSGKFSEEQVNSWLAEKLPQHPKWLPPGVGQPRVKFSDETIQLAFRYEYEGWSTVVSCEVRPHMQESNVLAVEIRGARAGLIPLPLENVLSEISARLKKAGWPAERTKSDGYDVFLVDLNRSSREQPVLESVDLEAGVLELSGSGKPADGTRLAEIFDSYVYLP